MRRTVCALLLGLLSTTAVARVELVASPEIASWIRPFLDENSSPASAGKLATEILATEGYFSPQVVAESLPGDGHLRLQIDPGPRTLINAVNLAVDGPVTAKTLADLRAGWRLPVGLPFRQADWNAAKQQVLSELLAVEHAAARLVDSRAEIDADTQQARLHIVYDAGPRYRFGELQIDGLDRYPPALIDRYNRSARDGAPYRADDLANLVATLQATPYFASVRGELDLSGSEAAADGSIRAPIRLRIRERPAHRAAFGAGFSSNTGARVEANYKTPNLFGQAMELDSGLRLEQKRQTLYADVFLPPDSRQRRHSVGAMRERSHIENLELTRHALGLQSVQQRGRIEQRLSLNWQQEQRRPDGAASVSSRALVPNISWLWRNIDQPLDPRRGTILQFSIGGGARAALSDQDFLRLHGRWQQYWPIGARDTLSVRGELGRTLTNSRLHIPQDYLFRTGGTGSVRGYGYQSLGLREGKATVGGRYLATGSIEYTHWLKPDWGIAAFVDAGDAVDALRDARLAVGYGLGMRWRSPAGPIAADLAWGEREQRLHLHFSLAIAF